MTEQVAELWSKFYWIHQQNHEQKLTICTNDKPILGRWKSYGIIPLNCFQFRSFILPSQVHYTYIHGGNMNTNMYTNFKHVRYSSKSTQRGKMTQFIYYTDESTPTRVQMNCFGRKSNIFLFLSNTYYIIIGFLFSLMYSLILYLWIFETDAAASCI